MNKEINENHFITEDGKERFNGEIIDTEYHGCSKLHCSIEFIVGSDFIDNDAYSFILEESDDASMTAGPDTTLVPSDEISGKMDITILANLINKTFELANNSSIAIFSNGKKRYQRLSIIANSVNLREFVQSINKY